MQQDLLIRDIDLLDYIEETKIESKESVRPELEDPFSALLQFWFWIVLVLALATFVLVWQFYGKEARRALHIDKQGSFGSCRAGSRAIHPQFAGRGKLVVRAATNPASDVSGTVKQIREAVQKSLSSRTSRIEVQTPKSASFQLEKSATPITGEANVEQASTRELARLFIEFFRGNELGIVVIFPDKSSSEKARKIWGPDDEYRLTNFKELRKGGKSGFGASSFLKDGEQVVVVAGGGSKEMTVVQKMSSDLGMDVLIIALNIRVDRTAGKDAKVVKKFTEDFEPVYWYQINPHPKWNGGMLFKTFGEDWLLCRVGALRQVKYMIQSPDQPSMSDIDEAFRKEKEDQGPNFMEKVSTLFSPLLQKKDEDEKK